MKRINLQRFTDIDDQARRWIAVNFDGVVVSFVNPPVRDYGKQAWVDSVDGSYGELVPCVKWEIMVYELSKMTDMTTKPPGKIKCAEAYENAKKVLELRASRNFQARKPVKKGKQNGSR